MLHLVQFMEDSKTFPFTENLDLNPLNFYGQTKLLNEKIANIYKKILKSIPWFEIFYNIWTYR